MPTVALTGSFDPPHDGHKYLIDQAKLLGLKVLIVVANNKDKIYMGSVEERVRWCKMKFQDCYVTYNSSDNIGAFIKDMQCVAIIRGLRNTKDFEYERMITDWNLEINDLPTIYIPAPKQLREISSTKIRESYNVKV